MRVPDVNDYLPPNRLERQNGVPYNEYEEVPHAEAEAQPDFEEEQIGVGINLPNWSLNQHEDGCIHVLTYCSEEDHHNILGEEFGDYYIGQVYRNGQIMYLYEFIIREQVHYIEINDSRVWRFNMGPYLMIGLCMEFHDGATNMNHINSMLNPVPFQE